MSIKFALAGNPNCGKTTLFNNLTGSNQYVGTGSVSHPLTYVPEREARSGNNPHPEIHIVKHIGIFCFLSPINEKKLYEISISIKYVKHIAKLYIYYLLLRY